MSLRDRWIYFARKYLRTPKSPKLIPGRKYIACIGDSITYGAGVGGKTELTWEHYLNELIGDEYQVLNYGFSARTLQREGDFPYTDERFYRESQNCGAEIYLIMLGTNDAKPYNWDSERYARQLDEFSGVYQGLSQRPRVVLMTPPVCYEDPAIGKVGFDINGDTINDHIVPIVKHTAVKRGLEVIDLHEYTEGHPEWFVDGVHPNELGNREIAEYIAKELGLSGAGTGEEKA